MKSVTMHKSANPVKTQQQTFRKSDPSNHLLANARDHKLSQLAEIANHNTGTLVQRVSKSEEEEPVQKKGNEVIQFSRLGQDRERIRQNRNNRVRFLAILMVIAANIANGAYALEDVDDLVEEPDQVMLRDEVRERRARQEERRAQQQQQNRQQKDMRHQFNNKGKNSRGR
jgi:hypothetical protein